LWWDFKRFVKKISSDGTLTTGDGTFCAVLGSFAEVVFVGVEQDINKMNVIPIDNKWINRIIAALI
jgi:hypothetical protein